MVRSIGLFIMTPKTYDNHMFVRQTDKDDKIVLREHISLRKKLAIFFN